MGVLRRLFSRPVTLREMKASLQEVERERRKKQAGLARLAARRDALIERIRRARKRGNALEVDYVWEDLRDIRIDAAHVRREARILNLEGIALKRYIRGVERLERRNDSEGVRRLLERARRGRLADLLARQQIDEREYLQELQAILEEAGAEAMLAEAEEEDPEKARFLAEIDAINEAEEAGDVDAAAEREARLRAELEEDDG